MSALSSYQAQRAQNLRILSIGTPNSTSFDVWFRARREPRPAVTSRVSFLRCGIAKETSCMENCNGASASTLPGDCVSPAALPFWSFRFFAAGASSASTGWVGASSSTVFEPFCYTKHSVASQTASGEGSIVSTSRVPSRHLPRLPDPSSSRYHRPSQHRAYPLVDSHHGSPPTYPLSQLILHGDNHRPRHRIGFARRDLP